MSSNTIYTYRVFAFNAAGNSLSYTNEASATTSSTSGGGTGLTVTDCDGNVYHSVTIGTQTWMVENLKTTKYRDCSSIPNVTDSTTWVDQTVGGYCNYNNDASYVTTYGRLYNWNAVNDPRNLAPAGWHVPTKAEWTTLKTFLSTSIGGKLKEAGTTHWISPNTAASNSSGFTGLPGGGRNSRSAAFYELGKDGYWWSSTSSSSSVSNGG